jgi:hypothetical protein
MSRDNRKQKNEPKNAPPTKLVSANGPSAKERRHDRAIHRAQEAREQGKRGGKQAQAKIDAKAATRRRMKSYTPAVRAERSAAGREYRKPRK